MSLNRPPEVRGYDRGRRGIVAHNAQTFQTSDGALIQARFQRLEVRIETAVEAYQQDRFSQLPPRMSRSLKTQSERLLAKDRSTYGRDLQRLIQMSLGRTCDDHAGNL